MIEKIKRFWAHISAFVVLNFVVFSVASIMSEPYEIEDIFAPMVLVFQIIAIMSSLFASFAVTLVLSSKTNDFKEQLWVAIFSVVLFSLIGIAINFFFLLLFSTEQWEQGYLDATLALPFEVSMEQFKTLTFFDSIREIFSSLAKNIGASLIGFLLARKLMKKSVR